MLPSYGRILFVPCHIVIIIFAPMDVFVLTYMSIFYMKLQRMFCRELIYFRALHEYMIIPLWLFNRIDVHLLKGVYLTIIIHRGLPALITHSNPGLDCCHGFKWYLEKMYYGHSQYIVIVWYFFTYEHHPWRSILVILCTQPVRSSTVRLQWS